MRYLFILLVILLLDSCTISPKREEPKAINSKIELVTPDTCLVRVDDGIFYITTTNNVIMYKATQYDSKFLSVPLSVIIALAIIFLFGLVGFITLFK